MLTAFLVALSLPLQAQVQDFGWLVGSWREDDGKYFEMWRVKGDTLAGEAYSTDPSGNKTLSERTELFKRNGDFFYVADVAGPQGPVEFKITSFGNDTFVAENPQHDFPKKIVYKRLDDLHMQAFVGRDNHMIRYLFTKIR